MWNIMAQTLTWKLGSLHWLRNQTCLMQSCKPKQQFTDTTTFACMHACMEYVDIGTLDTFNLLHSIAIKAPYISKFISSNVSICTSQTFQLLSSSLTTVATTRSYCEMADLIVKFWLLYSHVHVQHKFRNEMYM